MSKQLFKPSANVIAKGSIFGVLLLAVIVSFVGYRVSHSSYVRGQNIPIEQPVPFSHKHHVNGLGIDCRFCHKTVEKSSTAGMPSTETCMKCHSVIWKDSPMLEPVRQSYQTGKPLEWNRVHNLPDYVYFNHSIHVNKGVSCVSCHGQVDQMPLTWKQSTLHMKWCLNCHRNPEKQIRPREEIFNMNWHPNIEKDAKPEELMKQYHVKSMLNCTTCHR